MRKLAVALGVTMVMLVAVPTLASSSSTAAPEPVHSLSSGLAAGPNSSLPFVIAFYQADQQHNIDVMNEAAAKKAAAIAAAHKPAAPHVSKSSGGGGGAGGGFACIRAHESDSAGGYSAVNPNGHYGAYQFSQSTWNSTASRHGRGDLVGVRPDQASPGDQDQMAQWLQQDAGWSQWSTAGQCNL